MRRHACTDSSLAGCCAGAETAGGEAGSAPGATASRGSAEPTSARNVALAWATRKLETTESVALDVWVPGDAYSCEALCEAILRLFRDEGNRDDRQKARLM